MPTADDTATLPNVSENPALFIVFTKVGGKLQTTLEADADPQFWIDKGFRVEPACPGKYRVGAELKVESWPADEA
ncbi:hypothetical protein NZL82_01615 [Sphingomonas sanguinis]|uniref:hypothetical protein n=1 Tax=Sphingomonas sp. LC-1 TaxID=3110957 RepID=UPI0021BA8B0C|nr:hypothetical protein [Sphingomonas sp. LC-1]MCT8000569.1 hypothetical protein [Sphingomonas sp. LC-1]